MVGVFVQQHFLPFYSETYMNCESFKALKAEAQYGQHFHKGKYVEEPVTKGKISGFGDFIKKSIKSELGNATIAEVQELLEDSKILSLKWKHPEKISIILADGTIIYIWIKNAFTNEYYCDVDRFFKFTDPVSDVAYSDQYVLFLFGDNRLLVLRKFHNFNQTGPAAAHHKLDLSNTEVTVNTYADLIPNIVARRFEKKLVINEKSTQIMIWWSGSKDDVFPWSPKPEQRANILVYTLEQSDPVLISHHKTDNNLLDAGFVPASGGGAYTLELCCDQQGSVIVNEVVYQVEADKFVPVCETAIPLQSELKCFAYDDAKEKLALGCCDSSIVLYSQEGKVTHYTKAAFIPVQVSWHNDSYMVFAVGDRGQYQLFDIALSPLLLVDSFSSMPSLTKELVPSFLVERLCWSPTQPVISESRLLIRFETGTLGILRLSVGHMKLTDLCTFHLTHGHYKEAIKALKYIYWSSDDCLYVMFNIYNYLMRQLPSEDIESNFEMLLATYFVPAVPFDDKVRRRHGKPMRVLARRFFMWLLKERKYPRALQIAVSLGEDRLLKKLHEVASAQGDSTVATEAAFRMMSRRSKRAATSSSSTGSGRSTSPSGSTCSCHSSSGMSEADFQHHESKPLGPVSVTIPKNDMVVLEPPSPYRNSGPSTSSTGIENLTEELSLKESKPDLSPNTQGPNKKPPLPPKKGKPSGKTSIQVVNLGPV